MNTKKKINQSKVENYDIGLEVKEMRILHKTSKTVMILI